MEVVEWQEIVTTEMGLGMSQIKSRHHRGEKGRGKISTTAAETGEATEATEATGATEATDPLLSNLLNLFQFALHDFIVMPSCFEIFLHL